jgi:tetratricopeptide (TPR) repeat protein
MAVAAALLAAGLLLPTAACRRSAAAKVEHIAVAEFQNLSGDPRLDWLALGAPEILGIELSGAQGLRVYPVPSLRDALSTRASRILHGSYARVGDRLRFTIMLEDRSRQAMASSFAVSGPAEKGALPLLQEIAGRLDPQARPFPSSHEGAVRAWVEALHSPNPAASDAAFERALTLDPSFGPAYVGWGWRLTARSERERAMELVERAKQHTPKMGAIERAQIELQDSLLQDNFSARLSALETLTQLAPADLSTLRAAGEANLQLRRYSRAADLYSRALERQPDDIQLLNLLSYAQAYAGDLQAAQRSNDRYRELQPQAANPHDSLGDFLFYAGRFAEAEVEYRQAFTKSPALAGGLPLLKAAFSRLQTGDLQGADALFEEYAAHLESVQSPAAGLRRAQWQYLTGRRDEAKRQVMAMLDERTTAGGARPAGGGAGMAGGAVTGAASQARAAAPGPASASRTGAAPAVNRGNPATAAQPAAPAPAAAPRVAAPAPAATAPPPVVMIPRTSPSILHSQLAVWSVVEGDLASARGHAEEALAKADSAPAQQLAMIARFLSRDVANPEKWRVAGASMFPNRPPHLLGRLALAYALVSRRYFEEAVPVLQDLLARAQFEGPEPVPTLLAWSLVETGQWEQAAPLLNSYSINQFVGEQIFTPLVFPRILELRARFLEHQRREKEAEHWRSLYNQIKGSPASGSKEPHQTTVPAATTTRTRTSRS